MASFLARRLGQAVIVMLVVTAVAFVMFRFLGDPLVALLGIESTEAQRQAVRAELGLDQPIPVQFLAFLGDVLQGNFGISYRLGRAVETVLVERLPATVELAVSGMLIAVVIGIPAGVYAALNRRSLASRLLLSASLFGISMPSFFMGLILIWLFSVTLGWLPSFGRGEVVAIGWWTTGLLTAGGLKALIMPSLTLAAFQIAMIMRLVRAEMLEVVRTDYIRFARARGLSHRAVHYRHALRNTLIPVVTIIGLQLGSIIAFAVITESVFQWPGLGLLFLQSVATADVTMMSAYLILIAALFVGINLVVDLLYLVIDPRLRGGSEPGGELMAARDMPAGEAVGRRPGWRDRLARSDLAHDFVRDPSAIAASAILLVFVAASLAPQIVAPYDAFDPNQFRLTDAFLAPVWLEGGDPRFLLGTDDQGRDMISAIIFGARVSLFVGLAGVLLAVIIGVAAGLVAGFVGGWVDAVTMRVADIQLTFPAILIAVMVDGISRAAFGQADHNRVAVLVLILAIGLSGWVQYARPVRGATLVERNREYVAAATMMGIARWAIMLKHILPNVLTSVLVIGTIHLAVAVILEATLSFVGLGVPPTEPSLGTLIRIGNGYLFSGEWWIAIVPGCALVILVLSINLLGDFLRDALNPRLK